MSDLVNELQTESLPQVKILRKEIADLKRRLEGRETNADLIIHAVKEAMDEPLDLIITPPPKQSKKQCVEIPILHLTDIHVGKSTPSYDTATAALRIQKAVASTLEIINLRRSLATIDEMRLYLGGDIIEGEMIFAHQAHTIDSSVFQQAVKNGPEIIASAILSLLQGVQRIKVVGVPGNHGRSGAYRSSANPETNWDTVLYEIVRHIVQRQLVRTKRENDVTWDVPADREEGWYAVDRTFGWGHLLVHGNKIRGGFAGFPFYGTAKKAWGWIDTIKESWDYLWFGHFHTEGRITLNNRVALHGGSTESSNVHAREELAATGHPQQRLAFFTAKLGLVSDESLYLGDERKPNR